MTVLSAVVGKNNNLICSAFEIYKPPKGGIIADVTYGRGVFWKNLDLSDWEFRPTDLMTGTDFRDLPYNGGSIDMVTLDPPYMHGSSAPIHSSLDAPYRNNLREGHGGRYVLNLYLDGMAEAKRVLKKGGTLWVKCQDQVESGKNRFDHISIYNDAISLGFLAEDLFVLVTENMPMMRHNYQLHARKNHSYLWIFRKVDND